MFRMVKKLRQLIERPQNAPTSPHLGSSQETVMSEDQREKILRLLMTAERLAVDLRDRTLVTSIKKAIADARLAACLMCGCLPQLTPG